VSVISPYLFGGSLLKKNKQHYRWISNHLVWCVRSTFLLPYFLSSNLIEKYY